MLDPRDELQHELDLVGVNSLLIEAMTEICHTAAESEVIEFRVDNALAETLMKLCHVAHKYFEGVPPKLRM